MNDDKLRDIAREMVADGKGILAADESIGSVEKKLSKVGLENNQENRRAYREMLFTTPNFGEYISGVIMFDETFRDSASTGEKFTDLLLREGALPGIKVDEGTKEMVGFPNEKVTKGLAGLPPRLKEYAELGAKFAKWRAVITIHGFEQPTDDNLLQNAKDLAGYAKACQEAGIVPIVEPEVLMDGSHTMARCEEVSAKTLSYVFEELTKAGVLIEGMILKTNMVVPGTTSGETATPEQVADATLRVFKRTLPDNLPGQAFLSGGQSDVDATANLNAIAKKGPHPWKISFSYGRALQDSALKVWDGKAENVAAAQAVMLKRARLNSLATRGKYTGEN